MRERVFDPIQATLDHHPPTGWWVRLVLIFQRERVVRDDRGEPLVGYKVNRHNLYVTSSFTHEEAA